jgi:hypothetical protein
MVFIRFPNGARWFKANWVFRQLAEDVARVFPGDSELLSCMAYAQAIGGLMLDTKEESLALRALKAMKQVAEDTVEGRIQVFPREGPDEQKRREAYPPMIAELLTLIDRQLGSV